MPAVQRDLDDNVRRTAEADQQQPTFSGTAARWSAR